MAKFIGKHARAHVEIKLYLPIDPETGEIEGLPATGEALEALFKLATVKQKRGKRNP